MIPHNESSDKTTDTFTLEAQSIEECENSKPKHKWTGRDRLFSEFDNHGRLHLIEEFFHRLQIGTLLSKCGFNKIWGIGTTLLMLVLVLSPFSGNKSINGFFTGRLKEIMPFHRASLYRFVKRGLNWSLLTQHIAKNAIDEINKNIQPRTGFFVLDDTLIERGSCELLARVFDHNAHQFLKGVLSLLLGWTDGISFITVDSKTVSSPNKENRYSEACKKYDGRTIGALIRKEATTSKTVLAVKMVKAALRVGIKAKYMLMDSWFLSSDLLKTLSELGLDTICMSKSHYVYATNPNGKGKNIAEIAEILRQRNKRNNKKANGSKGIIGSTIVYWHGIALKIVIARDYSKNEDGVIALVSTDVSLSAKEIIHYYGFRWKIETNFKASKQYFGLDSECISTDFDAINAFIHISYIRCILAETIQRLNNDVRTIGGIFKDVQQKTLELPYHVALSRLIGTITAIENKILDTVTLSKEQRDNIKAIFKAEMEKWYDGIFMFIRDSLMPPENSCPQ